MDEKEKTQAGQAWVNAFRGNISFRDKDNHFEKQKQIVLSHLMYASIDCLERINVREEVQ